MFPQVRVQPQRRWVDDGDMVSSGGISVGIDMSLHLSERLAGRELDIRTARQIAYAALRLRRGWRLRCAAGRRGWRSFR